MSKRSNRHGPRAALCATALVAAGALAAATAPAPAAASPAPAANTAGIRLTGPDAGGFRLVKQHRLSPDTYVSEWRGGGTTVRTATRRGAEVHIDAGARDLRVDVSQSTPLRGKSDAQLRAAYRDRVATAAEQVIAMGADPAQARKEFGDGRAAEIIDSWCVDYDAEDGAIDSRGCAVRKLDQDSPQHGRYIVDEMTHSAVGKETTWLTYRMARVETSVKYTGTQNVVKWEPADDADLKGSCATVNVGLTGTSGQTFGVQKEICGDTHGPAQLPDAKDMTFKFAWSGTSKVNHYVKAIGTTLVKQGNKEDRSHTTLSTHVWWTWRFLI
ncbi:hypothetical protein AB0B50_24900 [Streptomyces sp. NPDC041068]|uniref:hypothetical protein n=1 Tax=Streptomyces sp. NPDC041068 TaxID=3155130 RepID=UPI0033CDD6EF